MSSAERVALGARLKEARETLGLKQSDVTAAIGMHRSAISMIENGTRGVTAIEIGRFAELYRRSVGWFLGEDPGPNADPDLLRAVAPLGPFDRDLILNYARFLSSQKGKRT